MITEHAYWLKKVPSWIYKLAAQAYVDKKFPRHLFIETTASCNLKCEYCPREQITKHMDFRLFKMVIDEASTFGSRSFSLHLFGEPLMYPRILDACDYIKRKNKRHTILLTTNGTLLNRYAHDLIRLKVDKIIWSWRPEAKFAYETLERLKKSGIFTVRLIKETVPKDEFERWSKWPKVEIRGLHNYGATVDLSKWNLPAVKEDIRWPCYHLWLAPAVAWNGNILICCSDPKQVEIIGKFPSQTVHEAWTSKKLGDIRQSHLDGKYSGICVKCDVWKQYKNIFWGHEYAIKS